METTAHPVAATPVDRLAINQLGMWLFFASEAMLFAAFITARFYLVGVWRPTTVNEPLGAAMTLALLLSSAFAYYGLRAFQRGDRATELRSLLGTLLLGCLFVGGVIIEWSTAEFSIASLYGTAFFSTTGLHVAHLISGLIILALVYRLVRLGHLSPERPWGVLAAVRYWTFVDALWVLVIYPVLYLL